MADASCGGATPFKRLADHQSRDASHHQNRLVDRAGSNSPGSFRSAQLPSQSQDGFNSFMGTGSALPDMHHHHAAGRLAAHAAALGPGHAAFANTQQAAPVQPHHQPQAANISNWAADFQRFANHSPQQQHQQHQHQPPQPAFSQVPMPQTHMMQPPAQMNFQAAFAQPNVAFPPSMFNGGAARQGPVVEAAFDEEMSRWMATHGSGRNMEHVDAAMEQMARELELNETAVADAGQTLHQEPAAQDAVQAADLQTPDVASLSLDPQAAVQPAEAQDPDHATNDAAVDSDVSKAAKRLLESVEHEEGDKWKNSVFLSLMRDFRDGRKDIVDNEICETADSAKATADAPQ